VWAILGDRLRASLDEARHREASTATLAAVADHRLDPYAAADTLLASIVGDRT
jgi:hypothetical protein